MKKYVNKILIVALILLGILIIFTLVFPKDKFSSTSFENKDRGILKKLYNGDSVIQTFYSDNNYNAIGIAFANYGEFLEKGQIEITIETINHKNIRDYKIDVFNIIDNDIYYINYNFKKNEQYKLVLNIKNNIYPLTIYTTDAKIKNAELKVNDKIKKSNLFLSFMYRDKDYFNIWYYLFFMAIICLYLCLNRGEEK